MKLLSYILLRAGIAISVVISLWSVFFYFALLHEIDDEIEDALELYAYRIIAKKNEGKLDSLSYDATNSSFKIDRITEEEAELYEEMNFSDTNIFIEDKNEFESCKILTMSFYDVNDEYFKLQIFTPIIEKDDLIEAIFQWVVTIVLILIVSIMITYWWVYKKSMKPLYTLLEWQQSYKLGMNSRPLPEKTQIKEFQSLYDATRQSIKEVEETCQQQKTFIGNASHEMQTPLAVSINQLEALLQDESLNEQQMEAILSTLRTLRRLTKLNKTLLLLSKIDNSQFPKREKLNVNELLKEKLQQFQDMFSSWNISTAMKEKGTMYLFVNPILGDVLINNLLKNAFYHNKNGGFIDIEIKDNELRIENTGKQEALDSKLIFTCFYKQTDKPSSSGLGLALVERICKYSNLKIEYVYSNDRHVFILTKD